MTALTPNQRAGQTEQNVAILSPDSPDNPDATRRNPLQMILRRIWIVVACVAMALAGAIVYLAQATPIYNSVARIYVHQNAPRIMASDPAAGVMMQNQNFLYTQCELLKSWDFLATVPDELRNRGIDINSMDTFRGVVSPVAWLTGNVFTYVGRRDDIISIEVRTPHAKDAPVIANAIVNAFFAYHARESKSTTAKILEVLIAQKNKYDHELAQKRAAKLDFQTRNGMLALAGGTNNPILERLARLSQAMTDIELETLNLQAVYDGTKSMAGDPDKIRQLLETRQFKSETETLRREFRELRKRLAGLSGNYGPNFPELTAIQASIKQLNDEMAQEDRKIVEAYLSELEQRLLTAKRQEEQIRAQLNEQKALMLEFHNAQSRFDLLQSEVAGLEKASEAIDQRIKELAITEDAAPLNIKRVEDARQRDEVVAPSKAKVLFQFIGLGLFIGAILAMLRDLLDQRIRSAEEIKQVLGLQVLGMVPHILAKNPALRGLQLHLDPMSDVAEAYRTIRTAVYFGASSGLARTLLITSPSPGDGKTTLASNLAVAMAQAGNRILLLDADFRRPTQHKIFNISKNVGLSSVLAGETSLESAVCNTIVPNLDLLPCGPIPANPSEILNSQMFADLLDDLSERYDHVLLDSPPVMPVTDSRILAASCSATLLALRAQKTTRRTATHARDVLRGVGARVLGVVVNDVPRRRGLYGYYYGDADLYQYGYGRRGAGAGRGSNGSTQPAVTATPPRAELPAPDSVPAIGAAGQQA